jgi:hypothetical protein
LPTKAAIRTIRRASSERLPSPALCQLGVAAIAPSRICPATEIDEAEGRLQRRRGAPLRDEGGSAFGMVGRLG